MQRFRRQIVRPGRHVRSSGQVVTVTDGDIQRWKNGLDTLGKHGRQPPIILGHTAIDSTGYEGKPLTQDERKEADQKQELMNTIGWIDPKSASIEKDGGLWADLEVPEGQHAENIRSGKYRFGSPETARQWPAFDGQQFSDIVTHLAFVKHPTDPGQNTNTIQMSDIADNLVQFADPEPAPAQPQSKNDLDVPQTSVGDDRRLQSIIALLEEFGISLADDVTTETLPEQLHVALKTAVASKTKAQQESDAMTKNNETVTEAKPPVTQFGDEHRKRLDRIRTMRAQRKINNEQSDALSAQVGLIQFGDDGKLDEVSLANFDQQLDTFDLAEVEQFSDEPRTRTKERIEKAREAGAITPGFADQMLGRLGTIQMSDESATDQVKLVNDALSQAIKADQSLHAALGHRTPGYNGLEQLSDVEEVEHPPGSAEETDSDELSAEEQKEVDELIGSYCPSDNDGDK